MIRVLLVDDHTAFRQPLGFMLEQDPQVRVVGSVGSISAARGALSGVDVGVVDLSLPDGSGVELISDLMQASPDGSVLVLTASVDRKEIAACLEAGASGVLHKSSGIGEIVNAVHRVAAGEHLHSPWEAVELLREASLARESDRDAQAALAELTAREREVLRYLAEGLSDKEIAECLVVQPETVRTHMVNILSKLHVHSRLQALVFAIRHGAVEL